MYYRFDWQKSLGYRSTCTTHSDTLYYSIAVRMPYVWSTTVCYSSMTMSSSIEHRTLGYAAILLCIGKRRIKHVRIFTAKFRCSRARVCVCDLTDWDFSFTFSFFYFFFIFHFVVSDIGTCSATHTHIHTRVHTESRVLNWIWYDKHKEKIDVCISPQKMRKWDFAL